jgi:hypothetical protein
LIHPLAEQKTAEFAERSIKQLSMPDKAAKVAP